MLLVHPVRLLLSAFVCLVATACGSSADNTDGAAAATATAATTATVSPACAEAAAVKASMAELDQLDPPNDGKAGIQTAVDKVRTNLAALRTSAKSQWSTEVNELDGALDGLKGTIAGTDGDHLLSGLPAIVDDLAQVDVTWTALQQKIDQDCG
jgi:hypothetical protein